ncbi:hypothetical protein Tco_0916019 [Tanacetum coccineum]
MKKTDSDIQYAVSIKEDMAYLCLHFTKDHEGNKINTPYPENPIRRIQAMEIKYPGRYRTIPTPRNPQYAHPDKNPIKPHLSKKTSPPWQSHEEPLADGTQTKDQGLRLMSKKHNKESRAEIPGLESTLKSLSQKKHTLKT